MGMKLRALTFVMGAVLGMAGVGGISSAYAYCPNPDSEDHPDYEAHCGIWICLPGGFPSDCSSQYDAFLGRIRDFSCPVLPSYTLCTGNEDNSNISARRMTEQVERGDGYRERRYIEINIEGNISKYYY